MFAKLLNYT